MKTILSGLWLLAALSTFSSAALAIEELWVDVRSLEEHREDHIEGHIHIPFKQINKEIGKYADDKDVIIKLYCKSGGRAGIAKKALEDLGYSRVVNLGGISSVRAIAK